MRPALALLRICAFSGVFALPGAEIPKGSHVLLRMVNSITTRTAREGDYVYLKTATPIVADGKVLVPVDSFVEGVVTRTKRGGRVTGKAELGLRFNTLTLPGGRVIRIAPLLASVDSEGTGQQVDSKEGEVRQGGSQGADAARIATTGGAGAALGAVIDRSWTAAGIGAGAGGAAGLASVLLTRGREVELRQGSTVDIVFERPAPLD